MWPKCCLIWQVFGPWVNPYGANGQIIMTVYNYRSGQVHETLNGVQPSRGFRDMRSTKFDPNWWQIWQFLAHEQAHLGQMGKWPWQCTTRGLDNSTELRMEKICQVVTEIWVPQVWQPPAQPTAWTVTTIPLQPGGLRGKNEHAITCWMFPHHWTTRYFLPPHRQFFPFHTFASSIRVVASPIPEITSPTDAPYKISIKHPWPFLLTWINFNSTMDK